MELHKAMRPRVDTSHPLPTPKSLGKQNESEGNSNFSEMMHKVPLCRYSFGQVSETLKTVWKYRHSKNTTFPSNPGSIHTFTRSKPNRPSVTVKPRGSAMALDLARPRLSIRCKQPLLRAEAATDNVTSHSSEWILGGA